MLLFLFENHSGLKQCALAFFSSDYDFFHRKGFLESLLNNICPKCMSVYVWVCLEEGGRGRGSGADVQGVGLI